MILIQTCLALGTTLPAQMSRALLSASIMQVVHLYVCPYPLIYYDSVNRLYLFIFGSDKQEDPVVEAGEFQANNYTFKVVLKENVTWFEAQALCKKNKMDLASVADAYQQAWLSVHVSKAQHPLWIGLFSENVKVSLCIQTHTNFFF